MPILPLQPEKLNAANEHTSLKEKLVYVFIRFLLDSRGRWVRPL